MDDFLPADPVVGGNSAAHPRQVGLWRTGVATSMAVARKRRIKPSAMLHESVGMVATLGLGNDTVKLGRES